MPQIIKKFPDCTLVIAGRGPLEETLKKEAESLEIMNNIRFIGMRLDIPELLKLFDVYVLPSLWEGLPMVLLEAMAAGCPVVATDVGGVASVIKNRVTGLLIKPRNFDEIADAVSNVLIDQKLRLDIVTNSLIVFRERFDAKIMTSQYERLYK
jgi:glycosyltransferase involved in cell wall biosynthesis